MPTRIEIVAKTGSTNADLLARMAGGAHVPEGHWLIADHQTAGRGRQGRRWLDAPGNFMGSTPVNLTALDPPAASLSFVAALAVYEVIAPRLVQPRWLRLKWPNDVLLGSAKLCGILLEREGAAAVVGVGVNLAVAPYVRGRAVDSLASQGPVPSRDLFAADLAASFDRELARWREFGLDPILARWQQLAHPVGTLLAVHGPSGEVSEGAFDGLEPDGALRLRLAGGAMRVIHAGDVELTGG